LHDSRTITQFECPILSEKVFNARVSPRAIAVLKNCRRAMTKTAKLLVIEMVIPPGNEASYSKLLDLMMLVGPGGCDRTEAEYEALFQAGGFKLTKSFRHNPRRA
jgi:hypothetical protein